MADANQLLDAMAHHVKSRAAYTMVFERDPQGECTVTYSFPQGLRAIRLRGTGVTEAMAVKEIIDQLGIVVEL